MYSPQAGLVSPGSSGTSNGNPLSGIPASLSSQLASPLTPGSHLPTSAHAMPMNYNPLGGVTNPLAAAASQAIAATQQMQQGRRTASLKASIEAVNSFPQNMLSGDMTGSLAGLSGSGSAFLDGSSGTPRRRVRASSHFNEGWCFSYD